MFSAGGKSAVTSGYNINNSLRFRSSASAYLSRTPASAGSRTTWTMSMWVKRGALGGSIYLFGASSTTGDNIRFLSDGTSTDNIEFFLNNGTNGDIRTSQSLRDPSAWYHFVFVLDTTNATSANRMRIYVNGVQSTMQYSVYPSLNYAATFNTAVVHNIAGFSPYFDGYMTDINFIDGQALTPSSFGETDGTTGVWKPKKYGGSFGTNGFYLPFSDIATTSGSNTGLGRDFSGNGNFWNTNNISVTAGVNYDAMTDSPTNTSATVSNYATINPLYVTGSTETPIINANLTADNNGGASSGCVCSIPLDGGKWYWEVTITTAGATMQIGVIPTGKTDSLGKATTGIFAYHSNGDKFVNGVQSAYGASYTTNDVIGMTYDSSTGVLTAYKNNVSQGTLTTLTATTSYIPYLGFDNGTAQRVSINFGQQPFVYTPPTGFNRLNTFNLPDSTIVKGNSYMDATLYTGTGSSRSVTNAAGFRPDFVWIKGRSDATDFALYDSVRGTTNDLVSNSDAAATTQAQGLTAFNSNGFTVGTLAKLNTNSATYVGWQWRAGEGTSSSNTNGTIPSTVSVNATAGFSIVTYTGTGVNGTVGHGLGVAPSMIILKQRNGTPAWVVYHSQNTSAPETDYLVLNTQAATVDLNTVWNDTAPTSSVFSIGTASGVNTSSGLYLAYCWAQIAGFSAFGSYTGNGSNDGPFVYTGFRPKFVMIKRRDSADSWRLFDSFRNSSFNGGVGILYAEVNTAEDQNVNQIDILSNGFKARSSAWTSVNTGSYTYMAFAENPFKNALAR